MSLGKIDPDGYNIILQGDIVRFVEMAPMERRLLIEDIAGISIYEEKKHKALLELDKVDKRLNDTDIVLNERNNYLKELKKDRDQALKFKEISGKIKTYEASLLKIKIDKAEKEKKELDDQLEQSNHEFKKVKEKIDKLNQENQERENQINELTKEIEEKGEVEQIQLNKEIEALKIDLTRKSSRLDTIETEFEKIKKRRQELKSNIKETDDKIAEMLEKKNELNKQETNLSKEKQEVLNKIQGFREKNKVEDLSEIDKNIEEFDKKAEELQKEIHSLREHQHNEIRNKDSLQHQINTIDETIKKVAEIEKEHQQEIDELKSKRQEFKKSTLELNKRLNDDSDIAAKLKSLEDNLSKEREALAKLEARNITIKEASLGDAAIKSIIKLKKPGVYGTVAELGQVNAKYSLALEIAAGPRVRSIVVEDDNVASDCIKYLKQNKLGIATFLPLNKIRARENNVDKLKDSNGCHGLASDLVEFDSKFKKVFNYIFANTLVVDNIDVARRIGIGKAKYVTLDGDLAELSGVMQGGFRDKKRKGIGFKEKQLSREIDLVEEKVNSLDKQIGMLQEQRTENEEKIDELRTKKANLEGDIIKTEKGLHLDSSDLELSKNKKEELTEKQKDSDKIIEESISKTSELNKELAAFKIQKQSLRDKIAQLRNPRLLAEINAFEEKQRQLEEQLLEINSELKNIDAQINTIYNPEKEKIQEILKQLDNDEKSFLEESKEINEYTKNNQSILKEKEKKAKEFMAKFKELFNKQNQLREEIQKSNLTMSNRRDESIKLEIKINTLSIKNSEFSALLESLKQEFQKYEGVQLTKEKNEDQLKYEISKFEKMKEGIGSVNMRALDIYEEVEKEYNSLLGKKDTLSKEKADVLALMDEIEGKKKELFMKTFNATNENFKKIFSALSNKGDAYLDLENPENPFEEGVRIKVKITGMKFLDIRSLSGGEKTMTALAFIFAMQEHDPASFYILDEVDAALDKHNSERLANLIKKYSEKAQYVIISHNDNVISSADILYGVSMQEEGVSKVVSLKI